MLAGSAILFLAATGLRAQDSCQPVDSTGLPYTVIVDTIFACGDGSGAGDHLCLFDGDLAVGELVFDTNTTFPITLTAWRADPAHGLDGFTSGNPIIFSYYEASRDESVILQAFLSSGDGTYGATPYTRVDSLVEIGFSPPVVLCPFDPANLSTCGNEVVCVPFEASNYDSIIVQDGAYINGEVCFPVGDENRLYTAEVVAYNACGAETCYVSVDPIYQQKPMACFSNPATHAAPFDVSFTNCSSPFTGVSYLWDFGDGNTSTAAQPRHIYTTPGCYDVTLIVSNECYADTMTRENSVCVGDGEKCLQIDLAPNWNLISWNVGTADSIEKVLADIMPCVDVILGYDHGGKTYDPAKPLFSDLLEVDYRHGYWIRMNCPGTLVLCDSNIAASTSIQLDDGWNLVSYLLDSVTQTTNALISVMSSLDIAYTFDRGIRAFSPTLPGFSTMNEMRPGFGYWMRVVGSTTLAYTAPPAKSDNPGARTNNTAVSHAGPRWFSIYSAGPTLDGTPLPAGSELEFRAADGRLLGATTYDGGILRFTPVYETTPSWALEHSKDDQTIEIWVNGRHVSPALSRPGLYDRLELPAMKSTGQPDGLPANYHLEQNYPNPFNPSTRIEFSLPTSGIVRIDIFNLAGQRVATPIDMFLSAGSHFIVWKARDTDSRELPSGLYFYRIQADGWSATRKMTLVR